MISFSAALAILLALASPALADAPTTRPALFNITDYGAKPDGITDVSGPIQAAIDAAAPVGGTVWIPPGLWQLYQPVLLDKPGVSIRGAGRYATTISAAGWSPAFAVGVRRVESGGRVVLDRHRPDAFGTLDATAAPWAGIRRGLSTEGNLYLSAVGHPIQVGMRSRAVADRVFDGYGEMTALTVALCFDRMPGQPWDIWEPLLGMGVVGYEAGPWNLLTGADQDEILFTFRTSDQSEGLNSTDHWVQCSLAGLTPPYRLNLSLDLNEATVKATVNGSVVATTVDDSHSQGHPFKPGARFLPSRRRYPFMVGAVGEFANPFGSAVTPLRVWGLHVSTSVKPDAANDLARYFTPDASTLAYLPLTDGPARTIRFDVGGAAGGNDTGRAFLVHSSGFGGQVEGNTISDLAIQNGSHAILVGSVKSLAVERVRGVGSMIGVGSLPLFYSAPLTIRDSEFTGYDAGLSLWRCYLRADGVDVLRGGSTSLRFQGCNVRYDSGNVYFFSPLARTGIDVLLSEYGGKYRFTDLLLDTEGTAGFSEAAVRCELHPAAQTRLAIEGFDAPFVGVGDVFRLEGHTLGGEFTPGVFTASHVASGAAGSGIRVSGQGWTGSVRASLMANRETAGDGADGVTIEAARATNQEP